LPRWLRLLCILGIFYILLLITLLQFGLNTYMYKRTTIVFLKGSPITLVKRNVLNNLG